MAPTWKRPASVPLPTVYRRYTGPRAMPDGRKPNFWIQDIPPDRDEDIIDFMCDSFLKEEIFCASTRLLEDPVSVEEIRAMWREKLRHRVGLVAFTDWPDGPDHPRIAGCNVTYISFSGDHLPQVRGVPLDIVMRAMHNLETKVDVFERYGVDIVLNAFGLSVSPTFRGQELGRELLQSREGLMRALGLRLTITLFSSIAAQKQSKRAGFKVIAEEIYDDYRDEKGQIIFPNSPAKTFQFTVKVME